jgi:putative SOS response-associated peptidase YedK
VPLLDFELDVGAVRGRDPAAVAEQALERAGRRRLGLAPELTDEIVDRSLLCRPRAGAGPLTKPAPADLASPAGRAGTLYTPWRRLRFCAMCGRYMLTTPVDALRQLFLFTERPNLPPRYNIAPTQEVPIVRRTRDGAGRELRLVRWGLVPYWADDPKIGNRLINARAESVARAPAFRDAYERRRCLVPADGFFEWRKDGKTRQPLLVRRKDQAPFAFAGLWERWPQPGGGVLRSCTIITCPPNALIAPVHDRMPVILAPEDFERWLDPAAGGGELLQPCPAEWLEALPVSPRVNSPQNDDPECIAPLAVQGSLL